MINWNPNHPLINLGKRCVHIWQIDLRVTSADLSLLVESLSSQEITRAGQFHFEHDRMHFIAAHFALRLILSRYMGIDPEQIEYQTGQKGKPFLLKPDGLFFNLAHSHEKALVAITGLGEIGVDIEHLRQIDDLNRLAGQCFSSREMREFNSLPMQTRQRAFFDGWARKEAFIKALGDGLYHPLQNFSVELLTMSSSYLLDISGQPGEAEDWTLNPIQVGMEYSAAFALRATGVACQTLDFNATREISYVAI